MARMVLGEDDPALDLPKDKRWAASIYGKTREFSGAFREGISETLVLLAVHGGHLFLRRPCFVTEVQGLLGLPPPPKKPPTNPILQTHDPQLPTLAETPTREL